MKYALRRIPYDHASTLPYTPHALKLRYLNLLGTMLRYPK